VDNVSRAVTGPADFTFTVTLSNASATPVTVNYATGNGLGATAPTEYISEHGKLTFAPGQVTRTFTVPVRKDPHAGKADEFYAFIYDPTGAKIVGIGRGIGSVL
jgi:hypothetical protein